LTSHRCSPQTLFRGGFGINPSADRLQKIFFHKLAETSGLVAKDIDSSLAPVRQVEHNITAFWARERNVLAIKKKYDNVQQQTPVRFKKTFNIFHVNYQNQKRTLRPHY
jgi:hypothetical protein